MAIARLRKSVMVLLWFSVFTAVVVIVAANREYGYAQPAVGALPAGALAAQEAPGCPGERSGVLATGEYRGAPVEEVVINGEPWGGADWAAGHRSYWHCHRGGQILLMWDGEGRIQNRGERVRILQRGEMSHAPPWTEHWHGASPTLMAIGCRFRFNPPGRTGWRRWVTRTTWGTTSGSTPAMSS